jgi:2'-5' RNA ligase
MMTQGFAIELYFDAQTEKEFFEFRKALYDSGIQPNLGNKNDRPHVSLAVFGMEDEQHLIDITESFATQIKSFPVILAANGVFPTPDNVLFLTPVPSLQLIKTHRDFHRILKKEKVVPSHYYLPDQWVPHCTLEFEQPDDQFELMVLRCKKCFKPIHGSFSSLGIVSFRPTVYMAEYALQK